MPSRDEQTDASRSGEGRRDRGSYMRETPYGKTSTVKGSQRDDATGEKDKLKNPNQGG